MIYSKKLPNSLKIAISRSNLKISKNKDAFLGVYSRVPHAKNQLPPTKTVTCREDTDRQTHKQTEIANTEGPIDFFCHFFLDFFIDERSNRG